MGEFMFYYPIIFLIILVITIFTKKILRDIFKILTLISVIPILSHFKAEYVKICDIDVLGTYLKLYYFQIFIVCISICVCTISLIKTLKSQKF